MIYNMQIPYQNARLHNSSSMLGVEEYIVLRCAPTSSAIRMPAPITDQVDCGELLAWRNRAISCNVSDHKYCRCLAKQFDVTYSTYLEVVDLRGRKRHLAHPLDQQEPLPARGVLVVRAIKKHARVARGPRGHRAH